MLLISTRGKLNVTMSTPSRDTIVNGRFPYDPLSPKINIPTTTSDNQAMSLKLDKYTNIMTIAWGSEETVKFNVKDNYLRSLASMYVATVKCGVSQQMLEQNQSNAVGGILKYHIALTFQLMMENPDLLMKELSSTDIEIVVNNIPTRRPFCDTSVIETLEDPGEWIMINKHISEWKKYKAYIHYESDPNDYKRMIQKVSNGITKYGLSRITDSVLTMIYCTLLAQGKTGFPITNEDKGNGMVQLTQREFKKLHSVRVNSGLVTQNIRDTKAVSSNKVQVGGQTSLKV